MCTLIAAGDGEWVVTSIAVCYLMDLVRSEK